MRRYLILIFSFILLFSGCGNVQKIDMAEVHEPFVKVESPNGLIGFWQVVEGAEYQRITLDPNGYFDSFLDGQLFMDGEWRFDHGTISFTSDMLKDKKVFNHIFFQGNKLILEGDNGLREVWESTTQYILDDQIKNKIEE